MRNLKISNKYALLNCKVYGNGSKNILAFHGFGQDGSIFKILADRYPDTSVFSFDLFFHGESVLAEGESPIATDSWLDLIRSFFKQTDIDQCELVGFSFGAKLALMILEFFPEKINKLVLLAPDGVEEARWYKLATGNWLARQYFHWIVSHPVSYFYGINWLRRLGFISRQIERFAKAEMGDFPGRMRVYKMWVGLRKIKPNLQNVLLALEKHKIPTEIYLGKYDKVITRKRIEKLLKYEKSNLITLNCGHTHLVEQWLKQL